MPAPSAVSQSRSTQLNFLPVSRADMDRRGWDFCDFIFVSGDAYVDHPSFAAAIISRCLEADGFRVGIIPQPDWKDPASYRALGRPRLAFLAGAGNMDSMVAHYTAAKKPRSDDSYSPGGLGGKRPDRALLRYVEGIRAAYKDIPVIIGGIEASLRRFAHYDYWSDTVRRSVLLDSKADILVYGMGETPILEIARRLHAGEAIGAITDVRGTCVRSRGKPAFTEDSAIELPPYDTVKGGDPDSLKSYAEHFMEQKRQADPGTGKILAEQTDDRWVIQNPPAFPLSKDEFDRVYELPYAREAHPMYTAAGGIPALKEVRFSLTASRGCFGGCSFCAITFHQGRAVTARSAASLVREAKELAEQENFKGYIHDVGGPTANFCTPGCPRQDKGGFCPDRECLFPEPCPRLRKDHTSYMESLRLLRNIKGIKKVFIRSGIRFDYLLGDTKNGSRFLDTLCEYHVSGQLKVAPEHISPKVLAVMGKSPPEAYEVFKRRYAETNRRLGLKQYLIPYFISSHPGSDLEDAVELALYLKKSRFVPDQVQDFYPTPGTLSTAMYRTGIDPRTMEPVSVPRGDREKRLQRALLQFNRRESKNLVLEALRKAGRPDLIGPGPDCLIPENGKPPGNNGVRTHKKTNRSR
ncbi:YgiQ family radical SAM protein [Breznakiella homolactica]|uniref:YgiQ family radical SAM protein n=1 Tax=Breznakiella homolactica TaxID=2798577 RepID=A0A7T8B9M3_9SPIR|nr:YgiQ family radical SAM protein [Breznakiella homolactica]QQO09769.1 YgiQ family radical SAM protein [Breznakiella homolactica]